MTLGEGRLRIATSFDRLRRLAPDAPAMRWIQIEGVVSQRDSSWVNDAEAKAVVEELERMIVWQRYVGNVGVVTPFRAQVNRIRDLLHSLPDANLLLGNSDLLVDTVYRFQSDERDVMIFHPSCHMAFRIELIVGWTEPIINST